MRQWSTLQYNTIQYNTIQNNTKRTWTLNISKLAALEWYYKWSQHTAWIKAVLA